MKKLSFFLIFALFLPLQGCMEKYLVVKTNPDAKVWVDGKMTPENTRTKNTDFDEIKIPFDHYGTRRITVRKYGYWSKTSMVSLPTPWYQYFPIDIFPDLLIPFTITDMREASIFLDEITETDENELLKRAIEHRVR